MIKEAVQKNRVIVGQLISQCWEDQNYKQAFLANPEKILKEAGIDLPADLRIRVLENTPTILYSIFPATLTAEYLAELTKGLSDQKFALPEGGELRFVQNSAAVNYFVLPVKPSVTGELSEADLDQVAGGIGVLGIVLLSYAVGVAVAGAVLV